MSGVSPLAGRVEISNFLCVIRNDQDRSNSNKLQCAFKIKRKLISRAKGGGKRNKKGVSCSITEKRRSSSFAVSVSYIPSFCISVLVILQITLNF